MENSEPKRERGRSRWGNQTGAELSAWVWRTVTFTCMLNLGWRLNGTPSRAAERWVNDDCAGGRDRKTETEIADPPLIPGMLLSAGLSLMSLFARLCLLWLSLLGGTGGGGGLLQRTQTQRVKLHLKLLYHHSTAERSFLLQEQWIELSEPAVHNIPDWWKDCTHSLSRSDLQSPSPPPHTSSPESLCISRLHLRKFRVQLRLKWSLRLWAEQLFFHLHGSD